MAVERTDASHLYTLLVESVKDYAIFALDPEGRVLSWNPGAERLKGYTADQITGRHFSIFYPKEDIESGKPDNELVVAAREGRFEDEGWRLKKDGSRFWANVVITALRDADGELIGFAKITRDLTARRATEQQARQLAAESAAHAASEAKNQELRILARQLEEQAVELEAQNERAEALVVELEQANDELNSAVVEAEEAREIAREAEDRERIARAAAEAANMAKSEFLATMSHELRTPLNAIAGHVELLTLGIHGPITEKQRDALSRVKRAQLHLLGVITDLLNFARLEKGNLEYNLNPVALQDVVADLGPMIEPQFAAKNLTYEVRLPKEPLAVVADREKLVQVLLNLLSNSVKFTPAEGRVVIDIGRRADGTDPERTVFLRVTDTGIGIPDDKLETIFDPFVQLSRGHAARREGTGLGLAISRGLVRAMGGDLRARSTAGVSTTFTLTLARP